MCVCVFYLKINDLWGKRLEKCETPLQYLKQPGIVMCVTIGMVCAVAEEKGRVVRLRSWLDQVQPPLELTIRNVFLICQPSVKLREEFCPWCTRLTQCFSFDGMRMAFQLHQQPNNKPLLRQLYLDMHITLLRYFQPHYYKVERLRSVGELPCPTGQMHRDYENVLHLSIKLERMKTGLHVDLQRTRSATSDPPPQVT